MHVFIQEVREMWAGLGYYSRGHRLWEGAKKVTQRHVASLHHLMSFCLSTGGGGGVKRRIP